MLSAESSCLLRFAIIRAIWASGTKKSIYMCMGRALNDLLRSVKTHRRHLPPGRQLSFVSLKAAKNNIKLEQNESTRRPIHGGSVTSSNIIIAYHDVWRACSSIGAIGSHESSHRSSPSSVKLSFATVLGALWHVDTSYEEGTVQRCGT